MATCTVCGKPAGPLMSMCQGCIDASRERALARQPEATPPDAIAAANARSGAMHGWGAALVIAGLMLAAWSVTIDTTVAGGGYSFDRVHNLGLLSTRIVLAIFAGFAFLAGIVLLAAAGVGDRLSRAP